MDNLHLPRSRANQSEFREALKFLVPSVLLDASRFRPFRSKMAVKGNKSNRPHFHASHRNQSRLLGMLGVLVRVVSWSANHFRSFHSKMPAN
jgi:hypothetical protein